MSNWMVIIQLIAAAFVIMLMQPKSENLPVTNITLFAMLLVMALVQFLEILAGVYD